MKSSKECALSFNPTSLKVRFNGDNNIDNTYYSQAMQDLFVLGCLNGKKEGTYLELGCDEPFNINNTWLLEDKFNWKGISVDINPQSKQLFDSSGRTSTVLIQDATTLNFNNITNLLSTTHIDYLSLDLEPASITLKCLVPASARPSGKTSPPWTESASFQEASWTAWVRGKRPSRPWPATPSRQAQIALQASFRAGTSRR